MGTKGMKIDILTKEGMYHEALLSPEGDCLVTSFAYAERRNEQMIDLPALRRRVEDALRKGGVHITAPAAIKAAVALGVTWTPLSFK